MFEVSLWKTVYVQCIFVKVHIVSHHHYSIFVDVDTSLTEKEVEALIDQTAMEAMVHDAVEKLKGIGQEAIEAQQKAGKAIQEHVEQLKSALAQSLEGRTLKDLSELVLNSQKAAIDSVNAAKTAQVISFRIMVYVTFHNLFTFKISSSFLCTICCIFPMISAKRIWCSVKQVS